MGAASAFRHKNKPTPPQHPSPEPPTRQPSTPPHPPSTKLSLFLWFLIFKNIADFGLNDPQRPLALGASYFAPKSYSSAVLCSNRLLQDQKPRRYSLLSGFDRPGKKAGLKMLTENLLWSLKVQPIIRHAWLSWVLLSSCARITSEPNANPHACGSTLNHFPLILPAERVHSHRRCTPRSEKRSARSLKTSLAERAHELLRNRASAPIRDAVKFVAPCCMPPPRPWADAMYSSSCAFLSLEKATEAFLAG